MGRTIDGSSNETLQQRSRSPYLSPQPADRRFRVAQRNRIDAVKLEKADHPSR